MDGSFQPTRRYPTSVRGRDQVRTLFLKRSSSYVSAPAPGRHFHLLRECRTRPCGSRYSPILPTGTRSGQGSLRVRTGLRDNHLISVGIHDQVGVVRHYDHPTLRLGLDEQIHQLVEDRLRIGWSMTSGRSSLSSANNRSSSTMPRVPGDNLRMSTPS